MTRPKKVLIGHRTYPIHFLDEDAWKKKGHKEEEAGIIEQQLGAIYVCTHKYGEPLPEEYLREVLLHEIMHGIAWVSGSRNTHETVVAKLVLDAHDTEEWIIGTWTPLLIDVLTTNPSVRDYLVGA